ncbi:MAG: tetratricopeptide repeat protein, partial [Armatimonadetes bacterium]|nr:tetratricopeptide repeat protein [Armatimonadota bacterium]
FLDKWPKSDRADSALFRIAESHMLLRQYDEALKGYGAYLTQYPKGEYVEQAQFRLAEMHYKVGDYGK